MTYDPDRKAPLNAGRPKAAKPPHERVTGRLSLRNAASIRRPGDAPIR